MLYSLIGLRIQGIDTDDLVEDLFILFPDLRQRIGNDRKAPLITPDILVDDLALPA